MLMGVMMSDFLKTYLLDLIGQYNPPTYLSGETEIIPDGIAGIDIPWLMSALLLGLSFYCVFRLVGVIINAIRN